MHVVYMNYNRFQRKILHLAGQGLPVTVSNVAHRLRISPTEAERLLDRMVAENFAESSIDENEACLKYRIRGLTPDPSPWGSASSNWGSASAEGTPAAATSAGRHPMDHGLVPRPTKSRIVAAVCAGIIPGFGLLYAAPVSASIALGIAAALLGELAANIPAIGPTMAAFHAIVACVISAFLSQAYVAVYNRRGERGHLSIEATAATVVEGKRAAARFEQELRSV